MKKSVLLLILILILLPSCRKKRELDILYNRLERAIEYKQELEIELTQTDNDEINERVSNIMGVPVTNGYLRQNRLRQTQHEIEDIQLEIERVKNR